MSNPQASEFFRLANKIRQLQEKSQLFREMFREKGPGRYDGATVYKVKGHKVKAHWRDGWTAVRVKAKNTEQERKA